MKKQMKETWSRKNLREQTDTTSLHQQDFLLMRNKLQFMPLRSAFCYSLAFTLKYKPVMWKNGTANFNLTGYF